MDAIGRVNGIYRLFVATIASAASAILIDDLQNIFKSRSIALLALLVVVSLTVILLNETLEQIVEKSVTVRKLIAGDDFIEGFWYDLSLDNVNRKVVHGAIFRIRFKDGELKVDGVSFDPGGNRIATFTSSSAVYSNRLFYFEYRGMNDEYQELVETGLTQLQFDAPPQSYSGFYFDYTASIHSRVHGHKVDEDTLKRNRSFTLPDAKRDFMLSVMAAKQSSFATPQSPPSSRNTQA
jgi:hypothetical protein